MTLEEINKRVEDVRNRTGDDESAHLAEDSLWADVLTAISNNECEDPAAADTALTVDNLDDLERLESLLSLGQEVL